MLVEKYIKDKEFLEIRLCENYDDCFNPRNWDNIGIMVCKHSRYSLGDFKAEFPQEYYDAKDKRDEENEILFEANEELGYDIDKNLATMDKELSIAEFFEYEDNGEFVSFPLYLYDHSGISMSVGCNPLDSGGWDTSMVGFIYAKIEGSGHTKEELEKYLLDEVKTYDAYLRGNVYSFTRGHYETCDCCGNVEEVHDDSCSGFLEVTTLEESGLYDHAGVTQEELDKEWINVPENKFHCGYPELKKLKRPREERLHGRFFAYPADSIKLDDMGIVHEESSDD